MIRGIKGFKLGPEEIIRTFLSIGNGKLIIEEVYFKKLQEFNSHLFSKYCLVINKVFERSMGPLYNSRQFYLFLQKPEMKEDMDTEISLYSSDPVYGEKIKTAYADLNKAISENADERTVDQKIDKLINAISGPLLLSFGTKPGDRLQRNNNYSNEEERNFFDVTGDVIGEEWKKALKKLGIGKKSYVIGYGKALWPKVCGVSALFLSEGRKQKPEHRNQPENRKYGKQRVQEYAFDLIFLTH